MDMTAVVATVGVVPSTVVRAKEGSLEGELYELRFALEPKRSVDDELSDIVERSVDGQNVGWIWVLRDRDGEDVRGEFGREARERHGGETRVPSSALTVENF